MNPDVLTVTLRTVTPLFLGGAEPNKCAELRPPSIKGVLRWWYRALHPRLDPGEEARIFGGADKDQGQAAFFVRVSCDQGGLQTVGPLEDDSWTAEMAYLGYGLIRAPKKEEREAARGQGRRLRAFINERCYIEPGQEFEIEIAFTGRGDTAREQTKKEVLDALWALVQFGGLGSRSRRGWGSLQATRISGNVPETSLWHVHTTGFKKCVQELLKRFEKEPPAAHTSFSSEARVLIRTTDLDWRSALNTVGGALKSARSSQAQATACQLYTDDKSAVEAFLEDCEPHFQGGSTGQRPRIARRPERAAFGLPHNYFFKNRRDLNRMPEIAEFDAVILRRCGEIERELTRRASPLLLHVAPAQRGEHIVVAVFLPTASFLPEGAQIRATARTKNKEREHIRASSITQAPTNFDAVSKFLDYLVSSGWTEVKPE
ncbi:MAG: type III-B CRISPR module RAMP protein Cmr1 [Armatimonadetes bacterium]|nr:type III-B CRISPR module RAMP protein Cmr1 [Armatimonadota bacterium]